MVRTVYLCGRKLACWDELQDTIWWMINGKGGEPWQKK